MSTFSDFLAGELKGVSVTSEGGILLAPALEQILDTKEAFIYAAALDSTGNLYLGTGNQGRIFRVGANGQGGEWAKLEEAGIHALAVDSSNRLYAASSPDGKVYRFEGGPTPKMFFDPEDKYIWALAVDRNNSLYVGTGPRGIIYKVDSQGKSETFYDSKETHIVSLELAADGRLLAGTAPGGLLFSFSPDGKPFVLHDSELNEVKAIGTDRYGNIYAAALQGASAVSSASDLIAAIKGSTDDEKDKSDGEEKVTAASGGSKAKRTEIYRIDKNNLVETIHSTDTGIPYDLIVRADGTVLVATSNKGRIISIDPKRFVTYLVQTSEEQVTQLLEREGKLYAATSNLGRVFVVGGKPAVGATFESKVFDAGITAKWGAIRWRVRSGDGGGLRLYTRSGNTSVADQTWEEWQGPYPEGGSASIKSAPARFLQWKVDFPEKAAGLAVGQSVGLEMVTVSYQQSNMPPRFSSFTVHPPGVAFAPSPGTSPSGSVSPGGPDQSYLLALPRSVRQLDKPAVGVPPRKIYYPAARSLSWSASDPNQDDLVYSVYVRKQGEDDWLVLEKELRETNYTINGTSLPDGTYFAKVTVSDRLSNPPEQALEAQSISRAFVVANTLPLIELGMPQAQGRTATLSFTAKTHASTVHQAEYSVSAGEWRILMPQDGIADGESEQYTVKLENLTPGRHQILIRVVDSVGNLATAKTSLTVQ